MKHAIRHLTILCFLLGITAAYGFDPVTFIASDNRSRFTLISEKEIEFTEGQSTLLGQYSLQPNKTIRVTIPILGSVQVRYLQPEGPNFRENKKLFIPESAYAEFLRQREQAQQQEAAMKEKIKADNAALLKESMKNHQQLETFVDVNGETQWVLYDSMVAIREPGIQEKQIWFGHMVAIGPSLTPNVLSIHDRKIEFSTAKAKDAAALKIDSAVLKWHSKYAGLRYQKSTHVNVRIPKYRDLPKKPNIEGLWVQKIETAEGLREMAKIRVVSSPQGFTMTSESPGVEVRIFDIVHTVHPAGDQWTFKSDWGPLGVAEFKLEKFNQVQFEGYSYLNGSFADYNIFLRVEP